MNRTTDLWEVFARLRGHVESCGTIFFFFLHKKKHKNQKHYRNRIYAAVVRTEQLITNSYKCSGLNFGIAVAIDSPLSRRVWKKRTESHRQGIREHVN